MISWWGFCLRCVLDLPRLTMINSWDLDGACFGRIEQCWLDIAVDMVYSEKLGGVTWRYGY